MRSELLDPVGAAKSIAARIALIKQCEAYVKSVTARYEGLKSFETNLQTLGVIDDVREIHKRNGG